MQVLLEKNSQDKKFLVSMKFLEGKLFFAKKLKLAQKDIF